MAKKTQTSSFGVSKREAHDSSDFYSRNLYLPAAAADIPESDPSNIQVDSWADRVYQRSSDNMPIPDNSVALAFTSPPYNVGKDYDDNMTLEAYLDLIKRVGQDVYRVLKPGGRYVVNIANLGRKPYIPLHSYFYQIHSQIGFLPMGEIIWQKGKGASGSCAWGSWRSAKAPRLRDLHEYIIVFAKQKFSRPDKGKSDLTSEEFMESTLSVWQIQPESAKKIGHPAPFPVELASRVISFTRMLMMSFSTRSWDQARRALPRRKMDAIMSGLMFPRNIVPWLKKNHKDQITWKVHCTRIGHHARRDL